MEGHWKGREKNTHSACQEIWWELTDTWAQNYDCKNIGRFKFGSLERDCHMCISKYKVLTWRLQKSTIKLPFLMLYGNIIAHTLGNSILGNKLTLVTIGTFTNMIIYTVK